MTVQIDDLRTGLRDLVATEPVDVDSARRIVQARAERRPRRPGRWVVAGLAAAAVVAAVVATALGLTGRETKRTRVVSPPPTTVAPQTTLPSTTVVTAGLAESLSFTGPVAGTMTVATVADRSDVITTTPTQAGIPACTNGVPPDPSAPMGAFVGLRGSVDGRALLFWWVVGDVTSPATGFRIAGLTFGGVSYQFDPTKVTADADRLGGSVDSAYADSHGTPVGTVRGHFRCAPAPSAPPTTVPQLRLAPGPYGFVVPVGWTEVPVHLVGAHVEEATFTGPDGRERVDYQINGGDFGAFYNADHSVNLTGANDEITCRTATAGAARPNQLTYTCVRTTPGWLTEGVVIIEPYPEGAKRIEVTVPDADVSEAQVIVASTS